MRVVVTGSSQGIGRTIARLFLDKGHEVFGIDLKDGSLDDENYHHYVADASNEYQLPQIDAVNILINNAGSWDQDVDNIKVNLETVITCTEKYGLQPRIKAIVNIASTSAHNGAEFPRYAAAKGGVLAYTKWTAAEVAKYGATCNSISPGGVRTKSNSHILKSPKLWREVCNETMLGKWAEPWEIADWVYFVAVVNKSMTAQDIIIDNGELAKFNFVW
jgi:3-oxoacyl-[acyl-carrier protein] reductase